MKSKNNTSDFLLRVGKKQDVRQIFQLIKEMSLYEKRERELNITQKDLLKDGFGKKKLFDVIVAQAGKEIIGFAVYYTTYSTWKGKCLFLHELFVNEKYRKKGAGSKLFDKIIKIGKKEKVGRIEWRVLNWNTPAIEFYKKYNVKMDSEWIECELTKEQLEKLK
jgi:GNAT superfamily N-acetyltransferase